MIKDIAHDDAMASAFWEDPEYATYYFNELLKTGTMTDWIVAIRQLKLSELKFSLINMKLKNEKPA